LKLEVLDAVRTLRVFLEEGIPADKIGTVVLAYTVPDEAYEIEFCDSDGCTTAMFAIQPEDLEKY